MRKLPFFPDYPMPVTALLESCREGDTVVYFFKGMPVFSHHVHDVHTFHMITAQFCVEGHAEEEDIVPAQGVRLAVELGWTRRTVALPSAPTSQAIRSPGVTFNAARTCCGMVVWPFAVTLAMAITIVPFVLRSFWFEVA